MTRSKACAIALLGAAATLTGYAAARSCLEVNAETVQLELVELSEGGQPVADRAPYGGATVRVYSTGSRVRLYAHSGTRHVWSEDYAR